MQKYETVIHIVTTGTDKYDAGEKAGQLLTDQMLSNEEFYIFCDPTKAYSSGQKVIQKELMPAI